VCSFSYSLLLKKERCPLGQRGYCIQFAPPLDPLLGKEGKNSDNSIFFIFRRDAAKRHNIERDKRLYGFLLSQE